MKAYIFILFVLASFFSCGSSKNHIELNTHINRSKYNVNYKMLIPSGDFVDSFDYTINNVTYSVSLSLRNKVIYLSTNDNDFIIDELRINNPVSDKYLTKEFKYRPGWGYYLPLRDGWYAGFDFKNKPTKESVIIWFFKYDFTNKN